MSKELDLELREEAVSVLLPYIEKVKTFNIDHIGYREFYEDGTSIAFCSNEGWYDVTLDEESTLDMSKHYAQELFTLNKNNFNFIIRAGSSVNNRFLQELLLRDMCNSLLIYKKEKQVIRMYSFIASSSNRAALTCFFNKRQFFELLVNSYQSILENIFLKEKYQKLRKPLFSKKVADTIFNSGKNFNIDNINLTDREEQCLSLLVSGATNKEIAKEMSISLRAVYFHTANIQKRLKVSSRLGIITAAKTQLNLMLP